LAVATVLNIQTPHHAPCHDFSTSKAPKKQLPSTARKEIGTTTSYDRKLILQTFALV